MSRIYSTYFEALQSKPFNILSCFDEHFFANGMTFTGTIAELSRAEPFNYLTYSYNELIVNSIAEGLEVSKEWSGVLFEYELKEGDRSVFIYPCMIRRVLFFGFDDTSGLFSAQIASKKSIWDHIEFIVDLTESVGSKFAVTLINQTYSMPDEGSVFDLIGSDRIGDPNSPMPPYLILRGNLFDSRIGQKFLNRYEHRDRGDFRCFVEKQYIPEV